MPDYTHEYLTVSGIQDVFIKRVDTLSGLVGVIPTVSGNRDYDYIVANEITVSG